MPDPFLDADQSGESDPFSEPNTAVERDAVIPGSDWNSRGEHVIRHRGELQVKRCLTQKRLCEVRPRRGGGPRGRCVGVVPWSPMVGSFLNF